MPFLFVPTYFVVLYYLPGLMDCLNTGSSSSSSSQSPLLLVPRHELLEVGVVDTLGTVVLEALLLDF